MSIDVRRLEHAPVLAMYFVRVRVNSEEYMFLTVVTTLNNYREVVNNCAIIREYGSVHRGLLEVRNMLAIKLHDKVKIHEVIDGVKEHFKSSKQIAIAWLVIR